MHAPCSSPGSPSASEKGGDGDALVECEERYAMVVPEASRTLTLTLTLILRLPLALVLSPVVIGGMHASRGFCEQQERWATRTRPHHRLQGAAQPSPGLALTLTLTLTLSVTLDPIQVYDLAYTDPQEALRLFAGVTSNDPSPAVRCRSSLTHPPTIGAESQSARLRRGRHGGLGPQCH